MAWVEFSSDGIGDRTRTYFVEKFPIRKQWALGVSTSHAHDFAAYFRNEQHARDFAATFGLTITDHTATPKS